MRKYSDEDEEGGGFDEEYIDDDYGDFKSKQVVAPVKKDFWEPPSSKPANTTSKTLVMAGASTMNRAPPTLGKPI